MADTDAVDTPSLTSESLYEPKSTLAYATRVGLQAAAVGTFVSTIQNALSTHSRGAMGFLTRTGGTIGFFGAMGASFAFTEAFIANQRHKNDPWNGAAGGCAAGFLAGIRSRSLPMAVGGCAVLGAAMGTFDFSGQLAGRQGESLEEKRRKFFKEGTPIPNVSTESSSSE